MYAFALAVLLPLGPWIYLYIALGGFSSNNSGLAATISKELLLIGAYLSLTIWCASRFVRHVWRVIRGNGGQVEKEEEGIALTERNENKDEEQEAAKLQ